MRAFTKLEWLINLISVLVVLIIRFFYCSILDSAYLDYALLGRIKEVRKMHYCRKIYFAKGRRRVASTVSALSGHHTKLCTYACM